MKTRIFKNWRTSLLGMILLLFSAILLCLRVITFSEFGCFLPTVLGLVYVQDTVFRVNPPNDGTVSWAEEP